MEIHVSQSGTCVATLSTVRWLDPWCGCQLQKRSGPALTGWVSLSRTKLQSQPLSCHHTQVFTSVTDSCGHTLHRLKKWGKWWGKYCPRFGEGRRYDDRRCLSSSWLLLPRFPGLCFLGAQESCKAHRTFLGWWEWAEVTSFRKQSGTSPHSPLVHGNWCLRRWLFHQPGCWGWERGAGHPADLRDYKPVGAKPRRFWTFVVIA